MAHPLRKTDPDRPRSTFTPLSIREEIELVDRVLAGDRKALHALSFLIAEITSAAFWSYGSHSWFDDLMEDDWTQEVAIHLTTSNFKVLRGWGRNSSLRAYLRTVADNRAVDLYRIEVRRRGYPVPAQSRGNARGATSDEESSRRDEDEDVPDETISVEPLATREQIQRLRARVREFHKALLPGDHEALLLHYFEQLSNTLAARRLGIKVGAFSQRLSRAHARAGEVLRNKFPELGSDIGGLF